jgi:cysteine synthase
VTPAELLPVDVVDEAVLARTVERFRRRGIVLPTLSELADPSASPERVAGAVGVDPDAADPANLFRVHWHNDGDRTGRVDVPVHLVLPPELTGVAAPVVVLIGRLFPMVRSHKVLAAYACLVPRIVTGGFDPTEQRAVWPSTGNYARGGVAISTLMGCRGVAVLPEGMSRERFDWLDRWVTDPTDVIRTPGSESNVKEIYDACARLARDPANVVFNQFNEYANHLVHWRITGAAFRRVFEALTRGQARGGAAGSGRRSWRLRALVSATGSAGTIAAGDRLKEELGSATVAVEALECPTMLYNGYGAHNIQGIGDKHIPLIHNVTNTDVVVGVSDRSSDTLDLLFNSRAGRSWLTGARSVRPDLVERLGALGLSGIANVVAAVKLARLWDLGPDDVVMTVATDGAELYGSEREARVAERHPTGFGPADAAAAWHEHLGGAGPDHTLELSHRDRDRIFNLGYFTWVEQQGVPLEHFDARRRQAFWCSLRPALERWDGLIDEFNGRVGITSR